MPPTFPAFFPLDTPQLPQLNNLSGTSETDAVNSMLSAIGEAPVTDIDTAVGRADVDMAVDLLQEAHRETSAEGWKFNTEWTLPVESVADDVAWVDPDGTAATLSIFTPPSGLLSWTLSRTVTQAPGKMDVVLRPSKVYAPGTLVFYDRERNRDGFENTDLLYIDAKFLIDWTSCPEVYKRFVVIVAGRRFIANTLGDVELAKFTQRDELRALRALRREQGELDNANLLDHPESAMFLGGRPRGYQYARPVPPTVPGRVGDLDWTL